MYGRKGGKADKAGGCMGDKQAMKAATNVSVGQQKNVNFMSDSAMTAPKMSNDKMHNFMPGGEVKPQ
jgi:hypothetical protein